MTGYSVIVNPRCASVGSAAAVVISTAQVSASGDEASPIHRDLAGLRDRSAVAGVTAAVCECFNIEAERSAARWPTIPATARITAQAGAGTRTIEPASQSDIM